MRSQVFYDCAKERADIKSLTDLNEARKGRTQTESVKMRMLINKVIIDQKTLGVAGVLEAWLKEKAGPALGLRNIGQIIDMIRLRDLHIQELLQRTTFEELGLT